MYEVSLEFAGFYKRLDVESLMPYIDVAIIQPLIPALSIMQNSPENFLQNKRMRFEQDNDVPTLYKFRGIIF